MRPYWLGLDIGTGSVKAVACRADGGVCGSRQAVYATANPAPGRYEQQPEQIWAAVDKCLRASLQQQSSGQLMAMGLSSAMHSLMGVDDNGNPLTPLLTWADNRAADITELWKRDMQVADWQRRSRVPMHPMLPLCKIAWWRQQHPDLFARVRRWVGIKEWIWHRLTGYWETDVSLAAATGLYNQLANGWDEEALQWAGIAVSRLPALCDTAHIRPYRPTGAGLSLPAGIPLVLGTSDGCAANIGCGAVDDKLLTVTVGSSGAVRQTVAVTDNPFHAALFSYPVWPGVDVRGGGFNNGGLLLQWLGREILCSRATGEGLWRRVLQMAAQAPAGSGGLLCLPYLLGERAPVWDAAASAVWTGLRWHHGRAHLCRSMLEGMAFSILQIARCMLPGDKPLPLVRSTGGLSRSGLWNQMLADAMNTRVETVSGDDASATGAARLAMLALGESKSWRELAAIPVKARRVFEPGADCSAYHAAYGEFLKLYPLQQAARNEGGENK